MDIDSRQLIARGAAAALALILFTACAPGGVETPVMPATPSPIRPALATESASATATVFASVLPAPGVPTAARELEQASPSTPTLTKTHTPVPSTSTVTPVQTARSPSPSRTLPGDNVEVHEQTLTLLAYPYESFWRDAFDPTYTISFKKFDAAAYDSAPRTPAARNFKLLVIENRYLRLSFLPELGGRLYQVLYKPTGQTIFYNNKVLKPTPWGPAGQGGWLAAGGMEWALPVDEHGYEWGVPWSYQVGPQSVTFWDSRATGRVRVEVSVTLPPDASYFVVHPRVINGTRSTLPIQFWINAQLALNEKNISPETEFILRGAQVFIHSTGDDFIPPANVPAADARGPANPLPWPIIGGRDLSRYKNWKDYLGVFLTGSGTSFAGAYNHANGLGIVRVFPRERVRGVKLFAWGPEFGDRSLFADDNSDYFELWGGLPLTFYDYQDWPFAPGETREWDEYWIPFTQTGGVSGASQHAVLNLIPGSPVGVRAVATHAVRGSLVLSRNGLEIARWDVTLDPGEVFKQSVQAPGDGRLRLALRAPDGALLAESDN